MTKNKKIGDEGEKLAVQHLSNLGYDIIATNWTFKHKEIDIICKEQDIYIFVEVKTRSSVRYGMPEDAISESKAQAVIAAAMEFLQEKKYQDIRFDVVSIILKKGQEPEILHIKDAFY